MIFDDQRSGLNILNAPGSSTSSLTWSDPSSTTASGATSSSTGGIFIGVTGDHGGWRWLLQERHVRLAQGGRPGDPAQGLGVRPRSQGGAILLLLCIYALKATHFNDKNHAPRLSLSKYCWYSGEMATWTTLLQFLQPNNWTSITGKKTRRSPFIS